VQKKELVLRGRRLSSSDIDFIKATIEKHWDKGRSYISRVLCQQWDWRQPNGWLKDRACRDILLALERLDYLTLPPRKVEKNNCLALRFDHLPEFSMHPLVGKAGDFCSLKIEMVRQTERECLWDYLVHTYHYLGNPGIVGSYLKYIVYLNDQVAACLGWGAPAWRVTVREQFIGWSETQKRQRLHLIVNNVRFLILPWIEVKYLASQTLAANIRVLPSDWHSFYGYPIVLLETFVDIARFAGTCYKASNWIYVGQTKGIAKSGSRHVHHGRKKAVYLYPLTKKYKERLTHE
jgi:hypothetical protein